MERSYLVYKHTSPSGKVYIGITKQSANGRWKNGFGYQSSPHFWSAIQKYGWENFSHEVLFEGLCVDRACELEKELIEKYNAIDRRFGYNEKTGGQTGSFYNEEARKKISESNKRFYANHPEIIQRIVNKNKGYKHTEEAKKKMSEAAKRRHCVMSDEWKQKIGEANKRRYLNDEELYKRSCEKCRSNGMKAARAVVQLTLDDEYVASFESAHEAERATNIGNGNISRCCRGSSKTAGGYKWRYANLHNNSSEAV